MTLTSCLVHILRPLQGWQAGRLEGWKVVGEVVSLDRRLYRSDLFAPLGHRMMHARYAGKDLFQPDIDTIHPSHPPDISRAIPAARSSRASSSRQEPDGRDDKLILR